MNGRTARAIRKEVGFIPSAKRDYHTFLVTGWDNVMRYNSMTGSIDSVYKEVEKETVECVSGARKVYKYMKRKFYNVDHEESFNKFPDQEEINELTETIAQGIVKEQKNDA